jgi:hypothetical protein
MRMGLLKLFCIECVLLAAASDNDNNRVRISGSYVLTH